jgi:hypothetical protein
MDLDSDGEDSGTELSKKKTREPSPGKRELSPGSKAISPGSESKRSRTEEKMAAWQRLGNGDLEKSIEPSEYYSSLEEDEALARALEESERFADRPSDEDDEQEQIQKAIDASIADQTAPKTGTSSYSAFVGQGRTLGGIQGSPGEALNPSMNRYLHESAAPWNGDASLALRSYYNRNVVDRNSNIATLSESGQRSAQSARTHPPISLAPQDEAVSLPNVPPMMPHPRISPVPRDPEDSWSNTPPQSSNRYLLIPADATLDLSDMNGRSSGFNAVDLRSSDRFGHLPKLTRPNIAENNSAQNEDDDADHDTDEERERLHPPRRYQAWRRANGEDANADAS